MILQDPQDTIGAIATPPGEGGIAIIRISGNRALWFAEQLFSRSLSDMKSHTARYGNILNEDGTTIDDALALVMKGNKSYTGEDTVELQCHGGSLIARRVLTRVLEVGVRAAAPGEFTKRAFLNGKLDLAQAESVQEVIQARNTLAVSAAHSHLEGKLSDKIKQYQSELTELAAILEAWVDFPEEGLEFTTLEAYAETLEKLIVEMNKLESTFHDGKVIHDGITLCLVGRPNVGKSSLMNALLKKPRAIVTHIAGTTRDLLEDQLLLNGISIKLIDTAGIRQADEVIEQEGIRRSQKAMKSADLVLVVLDRSEGLTEEDQQIIREANPSTCIAIWNKSDLTDRSQPLEIDSVEISAKEGTGLDKLYDTIDSIIWTNGPPSKEEVIISNLRQKNALSLSIRYCQDVLQGLKQGVSPEFLTFDLRSALNQLGTIIGQNITEEILSSIFSRFCIGK